MLAWFHKGPTTGPTSEIDTRLRQWRKELRERNVAAAAFAVEEVANSHPLSAAERVELALGILRADIQALQQSRDWLTQGLVEEIKLDEPPSDVRPPAQPVVETSEAEEAPKLSEVLPTFLDFMVRDQGWRGQTLAQSKTTYDMYMFTECCGDRPVSQYRRRELRDFYDCSVASPHSTLRARSGWACRWPRSSSARRTQTINA